MCSRRWRSAAGPIRAATWLPTCRHARRAPISSDVALALRDDRAALCREAQPPAAGMVWWRATIRARADAARTAAQPISVLQGSPVPASSAPLPAGHGRLAVDALG